MAQPAIPKYKASQLLRWIRPILRYTAAAVLIDSREVKPAVNATVLAICFVPITLLGAAERGGPDWILETASASWQARDSQGELVFNNRLWILGGWFNSFE